MQAATGKNWNEWLRVLKAMGASALPHKEIASRLRSDYGVPGWWTQSITVEFERAIGRREVGQTCAGDFAASASRTLSGSLDDALAAWIRLVDGRREFDGARIDGEPRVSATAKWRYWRADLEDGSKFAIIIGGKPDGKVSFAVNHDKLADKNAAERWKAYWREFLQGLA